MPRTDRPYLVIRATPDGDLIIWTKSPHGEPTAAEVRAAERRAAERARRCECAYGDPCGHPREYCRRRPTHIVTRTRGRFEGSRYTFCQPCADDAAADVDSQGIHEFTAEPMKGTPAQ